MYLFGKKALYDNLNNSNIEIVYLNKKDDNLVKILNENNIKYSFQINKGLLKKFSKINHQNIIIKLIDNKNSNLDEFLKSRDDKKLTFLLLDSIQDPNNLGSILRTAESFGVNGVIFKKNNQVDITDAVSRISMGAVNNLNIFKVTNLIDAINKLKKHGFWIYSSYISNQSQDFNKIRYSNRTCLVVGNENKGISPLIIKNSDFLIHIKTIGKTQSLNVGVATGILLQKITMQ